MNKRQQLSILLRILLPGVILVGIMLGSFQVSRASIKPGTSHSYVQAVVTEILTDYSGAGPSTAHRLLRRASPPAYGRGSRSH